jgi:hypothetical protein
MREMPHGKNTKKYVYIHRKKSNHCDPGLFSYNKAETDRHDITEILLKDCGAQTR